MRQKCTSIKITSTIAYLEREILNQTGLTKTAFHRKAIDSFLAGEKKIDDDLKIVARSDARYVKKSIKEPVYIDEERENKLTQVAQEQCVGITIVLFQAIMEYCIEMSSCVPESVLKEIMN